MSEYKGYDDKAGKQASLRYRKEKQHQVALSWKVTEYEQKIAPAIRKSGKPVATFVKEAVREKIERDGLA